MPTRNGTGSGPTNDLGSLLRARRELVRPEDVGLPRGERRRTPGLRRHEVASLAGISVEYLTRLEQGHDRHPSIQVVGAIADALKMGPHDKLHLHDLVAKSHGRDLACSVGCPVHQVVPATLRDLLGRLDPAPAVVVAPGTELCAWNDSFAALMRPFGLLSSEPRPSMIRFAFTDPRAKQVVADWGAMADALVTWLHTNANPGTEAIVDELSALAGSEFADRWSRRPLGRLDLGLGSVVSPDVGRLELQAETLAARDGFSLVVHLPVGSVTEAALARLSRPSGSPRSSRETSGVQRDRRSPLTSTAVEVVGSNT
ncbi:helix-turn-helix domain-containing protein [Microlunatus soli]|uniref:Transcriptional regulator, contains XRE-family HTH domain n=1 Tax=Microlunatus soli TaxID=630515 RepID=A0A1H1R667_9ACTN|nr:helix-turn-helix domain-containing protein [Microlunatus soli]SDS31105.1 Transcriptional regulator, contains XRE-family HTH domain [Microlunatus soli]